MNTGLEVFQNLFQQSRFIRPILEAETGEEFVTHLTAEAATRES